MLKCLRILSIAFQGPLSFDEAKIIRKEKLNAALFAYYQNPVFIWKVSFINNDRNFNKINKCVKVMFIQYVDSPYEIKTYLLYEYF